VCYKGCAKATLAMSGSAGMQVISHIHEPCPSLHDHGRWLCEHQGVLFALKLTFTYCCFPCWGLNMHLHLP
jgi:hypothetical protein